MTTHNKTSINNTQLRVLESASAVFAEKGYRDATIAEICEHASANVASVNYYFGDKRQLYDQVWRHAYKIANETHPLDVGLTNHPSPQECLYAFVSGMIRRVFSKGLAGHFTRLMAREMVEPTPAHQAIEKEAIRPAMERLEDIVRELLDGNGTKAHIRFCASSVIGQCLLLTMNGFGRTRIVGSRHLEALAWHVTRFFLAGIREVRNFDNLVKTRIR